MQGKLLVFSGPSGAGKGTILKELIKIGNYSFSVSMTTRAPRPGEVDGVDYNYISQAKFDKMIEEGGFLEYVHKFERSYGTPKAPILDMIERGRNVILDIEMEGALNVKHIYPETVLIYVLPPNLKILHDRLTGRGSETAEQIAIRTKEIQKELEEIRKYDYYVGNDTVEKAVADVDKIVSGDGGSFKITEESATRILNNLKEENNASISGN